MKVENVLDKHGEYGCFAALKDKRKENTLQHVDLPEVSCLHTHVKILRLRVRITELKTI